MFKEVFFNGPSGRIEGCYHQNVNNKSAPVVLVLHPDPLQGGTLFNKVVHTLLKSFVEVGFTALAINFSGVGRSNGKLGNGENEFRTASCALDWLQYNNPEASHYWISGFSFGSWIAMQIATRRPEIESFVLVAPPVTKYDFSFSIPCPLSGLIIVADQDKIAPLNKVSQLADDWSKRTDYVATQHTIVGSDHFFTGHLDDIFNATVDYVNTTLAMRVTKPVRKKRRRRKKRDQDLEDMD